MYIKTPTTSIAVAHLAIVLMPFLACKTDNIMENENPQTEIKGDSSAHAAETRLVIRIGPKTFPATLALNPTAAAFKARLPLTISMTELNGNEKFYRFPANLPSNPSNPRTIENGDLMLYTSNTLVLFYKTFPTSYPYTPIGKVENTSGLAAALGSGDVVATFELE
jgi:hypothetical protein